MSHKDEFTQIAEETPYDNSDSGLLDENGNPVEDVKTAIDIVAKPSFSYKRIRDNKTLEIPIDQQMVVRGDLVIDEFAELIIDGEAEVAFI